MLNVRDRPGLGGGSACRARGPLGLKTVKPPSIAGKIPESRGTLSRGYRSEQSQRAVKSAIFPIESAAGAKAAFPAQ